MALHYDDLRKLDLTESRPPVGYDVYIRLMDDYESKIQLTEAALKIGYLLGKEASNEAQ